VSQTADPPPPERRDRPEVQDVSAVRMADVSAKPATARVARAEARVTMRPDTLEALHTGRLPKGDALQAARVAGILAAKRTDELIPLCHTLPLECVAVDFRLADAGTLIIRSEVKTTAPTGVEMEALAAVTVAALTVYDMCKPIDRDLVIGPVRLLFKSGGRSGTIDLPA